ncbi:MAG: hypothetical protein JXL84_24445 [Deltaproteobacteria bacterium]|nr:hypothetical protein [Deltaproteobacteria bacterium]
MPENEQSGWAGFHSVLFPHSGLSRDGLRRILSFFSHLTLFLPWQMDPPDIDPEVTGAVRLVNPPPRLKPVAGFRGLLSEYKTWMVHNELRGYNRLLRASLAGREEGPTTQEIREMLRPGETGRSFAGRDDSTRWHLVLHLNRQMEEQEEEASRVLTSLREGSSPLRGVVEEETEEGFFDDLPPFDSTSLAGPQALEPVWESWFGLFGGELRKQDLLVTLNRRLLLHLSDLWTGYYGEERRPGDAITWHWPDLSGEGLDALVRERKRIFQDGRAGDLQNALLDFQKDPGEGYARLMGASAVLDRSWVLRYSPRALRFSLRFFPGFSGESPVPKGKTLENFGDRTILFVTQVSGHENE